MVVSKALQVATWMLNLVHKFFLESKYHINVKHDRCHYLVKTLDWFAVDSTVFNKQTQGGKGVFIANVVLWLMLKRDVLNRA